MAILYKLTITFPSVDVLGPQPRFRSLLKIASKEDHGLLNLTTRPETQVTLKFHDREIARAALAAARLARRPGEEIELTAFEVIGYEG